jgi:hypothetical protein
LYLIPHFKGSIKIKYNTILCEKRKEQVRFVRPQ